MKSKKLKNKKIIGLIYGILTVLLGLGGITILLSIALFITSLFNPEFEPFFPVIDVPLNISEDAVLELKNGSQSDILIDEAFVSFNINNEYGFSGILNYVFFMSILLIAYYVIFLLWKIFRSIRVSLYNNNPFHYKNIWRIRLIAFAILLSAILEIIYPLIVKYIWFNKIIVFDKAFDIRLNFDASIDLFWALIILVVAEIYRIGLEIKKDQELTI
ncbi:MAG: DUF2975 domain-containing protein [Bacteroidales bacterium]|jgi:magnesium-transporting ATPase (P-type)|nr:DUF2975 domain-containing protein [Bacteroidales bacterium]